MSSLALVAFIAGILTILAPCVLPVLPLILAWSIGENNKWYPYVVTSSLALSIVFFTVLLKVSTVLLGVPPGIWKYVSGVIVLFLGLTYVFPNTWSRVSSAFGSSSFQNNLQRTGEVDSSLLRAILTGAALGPVFSSCSPTYVLLLATVFPVSFLQGVGYTFIYALGLSLMLLAIARGGRSLILKIRPLSDESGWFRKWLWIVLILVATIIVTGIDKKIEMFVISRFNINSFEQDVLEKLLPSKLEKGSSGALSVEKTQKDTPFLALDGSKDAPWADLPEWINSDPITLESLKGKVVLIDFWTYSCINCQRTLPYLVELDKKYRDKGLVIIGAHAPEFAFERKRGNVEAAVKEANIKYPIVLDNEFVLWKKYENRYWPAKYFIDKNGKLRHYHFGEGAYEENEKIIRYLLSEGEGASITDPVSTKPLDVRVSWQSPETYFGTNRRERMVAADQKLKAHEWTLSGAWLESEEYVRSSKNSEILFNYSAKDVFLVMSGQWTAKVFVDGQPTEVLKISWKDSVNGVVQVTKDSLYHIVHEAAFTTGRQLLIRFSEGIQAYAFTFGG